MKEQPTSSDQTSNNIEVWEDLVSIKDLAIALFVSSFTTLTAFFLAPNGASQPLFYGLGGALIGFILSSLIIKPKRKFDKIESED
ncbi:Bax inhibitor 1 family protein [Aquibacillus kalidii]|uniref:hypothetical protein n=1 Tax=Aquibacillus kalidii TaxID=2762597 RepID=UPI001647B691|nr:hypothetical protein [Aquibacillus kalidii]